MVSEEHYAIGLDIGGARIKAGLVSSKGSIYLRIVKNTGKSGAEVVKQALEIIYQLLKASCNDRNLQERISGIGVGVTGQVDFATGKIIAGLEDKIPGWIGTPLKDIISEKYNLPVLVDNDGKVATLAEMLYGAHGAFKDMVVLTLGSGVGGGLVINGELHRPSRGAAGEIGHIIVNAADLEKPGYWGRLESYVSSTALTEYAYEELLKRREGFIYEKCGTNKNCITPVIVKEAALNGDAVALAAIDRMAFYLGTGLASIAALLAPDIIVLAGGLSNLGDLLLRPTIEYMRRYSFGITSKYTRVVLSRLGDFSGVLGAAALVFYYILGLKGEK